MDVQSRKQTINSFFPSGDFNLKNFDRWPAR